MTSPVHALETSAIVASLLTWHERHEQAREAVERALDYEEKPVLPAHAILESYSVLTRLPQPHRISPGDALHLLESSFADAVRVVALPASQTWRFVADLAGSLVAGGRTYDALIQAAALRAGASHLITLNPRHFDSGLIELIVPGE